MYQILDNGLMIDLIDEGFMYFENKNKKIWNRYLQQETKFPSSNQSFIQINIKKRFKHRVKHIGQNCHHSSELRGNTGILPRTTVFLWVYYFTFWKNSIVFLNNPIVSKKICILIIMPKNCWITAVTSKIINHKTFESRKNLYRQPIVLENWSFCSKSS